METFQLTLKLESPLFAANAFACPFSGPPRNFFFAPLWLFDAIIDSLQWVADTFNSEKFENAAELGRIGTFALT